MSKSESPTKPPKRPKAASKSSRTAESDAPERKRQRCVKCGVQLSPDDDPAEHDAAHPAPAEE